MRGAVWRVYGAEGREGGPWHAADPLPCCWALQVSSQQFSHRADTGRAGQAHELHCIVSGKGGQGTGQGWLGQRLGLILVACVVPTVGIRVGRGGAGGGWRSA